MASYRRTYTTRNRDGSRTTVSVGYYEELFGQLVKIVAIVAVLGWPAGAAAAYLRGVPEWLAGIGGEIVWLVLCAVLYSAAMTRGRGAGEASGPRQRRS